MSHPQPPRGKIAYFGQDCTDSAVIRRIASFQHAGLDVLGFTFRRQRFNRDYQPAWENVSLGTIADRRYLARLPRLLSAMRIIARHRRQLREVDAFYARNMDQALLAMWARRMAGSRAPLVYEALDVQRVFTRPDAVGRLFRRLELRVLAASRLLVVSSPSFVSEYFQPRQGFTGDWFLLENKICGRQLRAVGAETLSRPTPPTPPAPGQPWVIGWFGTLGCVKSLHILADVAAAMPDRVRIVLRGYPARTGMDPFKEIIDRHPNMSYGGEYRNPQDLAQLHQGIHLSWCLDFRDVGANSHWMLPNRLYDSGFYGVPILADAGTTTGRRTEELGMGWTLQAPHAQSLTQLLERLSQDQAEYQATCDRIAALPRSLFCDEGDVPALVARMFAASPETHERCGPREQDVISSNGT